MQIKPPKSKLNHIKSQANFCTILTFLKYAFFRGSIARSSESPFGQVFSVPFFFLLLTASYTVSSFHTKKRAIFYFKQFFFHPATRLQLNEDYLGRNYSFLAKHLTFFEAVCFLVWYIVKHI